MPQLPSVVDMDVNNNIIRGRSTLSSKNGLRESSIFLNVSSQVYHEWMEAMNKLFSDKNQKPSNSPLLSHTSQHKSVEKGKLVSKIVDDSSTGNIQYVNKETSALNNILNI